MLLKVKEVLSDTIFGSSMCCAETSKINSNGEKVKWKCGKVNIRKPIFIDDIAKTDKAEHIRKGINNCARIEKESEVSYGIKKIKYMIVKTGRTRNNLMKQ